MRTIQNIIDFTETFAPLNTAMDFDNCGLQVGSGSNQVTKVLLSLDITAEVIQEAHSLGAELIISHHPVIFMPMKQMDSQSIPYLLASSGISALCLHTNLDLAKDGGVNYCLAAALGLTNITVIDNMPIATGELTSPLTSRQFAQLVKTNLHCGGVRFTDGGATITKVAVSSGGGGESIFACKDLGVQGFVTGEIKHHEVLYANSEHITIVDAGHYKSENVVMQPLLLRLQTAFPEIIFYQTKVFTDRIHYV